MPVAKNSIGVSQASPIRTSPRKASKAHQDKEMTTTTTINKLYPTPLSMSPSTASTISISTTAAGSGSGIILNNSIGTLKFPPSFDPNHPSSSRYHSQNYTSSYTPFSPYRPGEYGRSERGLASDRTKIERKLFDDDDDEADDNETNGNNYQDGSGLEKPQDILMNNDKKQHSNRLMVNESRVTNNTKNGSSPLAPAFEAKMVLRNGASIDLISWLRTNFHHLPPPHTVLTPCMPLNGIRHLLLERFPRAPEVEEISKAVLAAFPHSQWDYPTGTSCEPPNIRGLVWHGKDIADEDEVEEPIKPTIKTTGLASRKISSSNKVNGIKQTSRSPTQSTLVSPISSSKRHLPDTPARSILEDFAEIATLADKTPTIGAKSLPDDDDQDALINSPEYQLDEAVDELTQGLLRGRSKIANRKRHASQSPELGHRRRASTSDGLHGLLAAAEAVEGSPITSVLSHTQANGHGHKRRRTIGGIGSARELMSNNLIRKNRLSRGTLSPPRALGNINGFGNFLPQVSEDIDYIVPLNDTASNGSFGVEEEDAISTTIPLSRKAPNSSTASQSSIVSQIIPSTTESSASKTNINDSNNTGTGAGRKQNELPTEGDAPGYDCKPPYPYHEMIRHAIENAPDCRLQLSQIYSSIADRFPFFKTLDEKKTAGWQNSIRHNLSLKKMFVRVNKPDNVPDDSGGKGGWWTVQPGVPDEGRPGRKAKAKKAKADAAENAENGNDGDNSFESLPVNLNNDNEDSSIMNANFNGHGDQSNQYISQQQMDNDKKDVINGMIGLQYDQQQQQLPQYQMQPQHQPQHIYQQQQQHMILPQTQLDIPYHQHYQYQNVNEKQHQEEKQRYPIINGNDNNYNEKMIIQPSPTQVSVHEIPSSQGI
ncbi:uncharacterized protein L201_006936 [Kwoniella dendrophila CBS 6074]|uniref:Fork-head domain-containing protein n=1 Tax=Kwoniella dendrophila CBS 6074 TaxID=1295534 RepID=A0AAX4K314_9TREE